MTIKTQESALLEINWDGIICYKNQERLILAMNLGMRLIGWRGDFYGLRIFAVSNWLCNLSTGIC